MRAQPNKLVDQKGTSPAFSTIDRAGNNQEMHLNFPPLAIGQSPSLVHRFTGPEQCFGLGCQQGISVVTETSNRNIAFRDRSLVNPRCTHGWNQAAAERVVLSKVRMPTRSGHADQARRKAHEAISRVPALRTSICNDRGHAVAGRSRVKQLDGWYQS
jgi:hypothetical protein